MTPKEKAEELFDRINEVIPIDVNLIYADEVIDSMKKDHEATTQCALIAANEVIGILENSSSDYDLSRLQFWKEVRFELNKL